MQEALHPGDRAMKCDLQIALCDALILAGNPRRMIDKEAPEAWSQAEAMGDRKRALRICISVYWALVLYGQAPAFGTPEAITWVERADPLAEPETTERALIDMVLGTVNILKGNPEGFVQHHYALMLARKLGEKNTFWMTAFTWLTWAQAPQHAQERLNLAEELMAQSREGVDLKNLLYGLLLSYDAFLAMGQRRRAEEAFRELKDLAGRSRQAHFKLTVLTLEAINAYVDGCLEEAAAINDHVSAFGQELDLARFATVNMYVMETRPLLYLGKAENAFEKILPPFMRIFYSAHLGKADEASESLNDMVRRRSHVNLREDESLAWIDTLLLEAAILVRHREAAEFLLRRFAGSPIRTTGIWLSTIIARHLGAAAAMLGRMDEAKAHYLDAIQVATDMRFRPELALTRFQLAELLLDHYPEEREQALEHLDFAIKEFEAMKMQPSLERAQALRESR